MINNKRHKIVITIIISGLITLSIIACQKEDMGSKYNPPADHAISMDGYMHKTRYDQPLQNCITCHGNDLGGGTSGVSCFECHGTKW